MTPAQGGRARRSRRSAGKPGVPRAAVPPRRSVYGERDRHADRPRPAAAAQGQAGARDRLVVPLRRQRQPDGRRGHRRGHRLRGGAVVPADGRVRRRARLEHGAVLGQGEFYLEYGSFDVSLTVPADMLVAATGTLQNPDEVLTAAQRARLARARTSNETVVIRGKDEIGDPASRPPTTYPHAHLALHRRQRARLRLGGRAALRVGRRRRERRQDARDELLSAVGRAAVEGRDAVRQDGASRTTRKQWVPYPYPFASNVNGIEGGMEYPMIVFCHKRADAQGALQRDRSRVRAHLVPDGGGQQRAAVRLDGRGVQQLHEPLQLPQEVPRRAASARAGRAGDLHQERALGRRGADHDSGRPDAHQRELAPGALQQARGRAWSSCASTSRRPTDSIRSFGSTSAAGRTSIRRRRISSGPWRTGWART